MGQRRDYAGILVGQLVLLTMSARLRIIAHLSLILLHVRAALETVQAMRITGTINLQRLVTVAARIVAVLVMAMAMTMTGVVPASASCTTLRVRAGDSHPSNTYVQGVLSVVKIPTSISGYGVLKPSAADVYLINGADFVQIGWYVGSATNLVYSSTPRVFMGEYHANGTTDEVLQAGSGLAWGSSHTFQISRSLSNIRSYSFLVDGALVGSTIYSNHAAGGTAAFNGEVNNTCTEMLAQAYMAASPYSTLKYQVLSGTTSTWYLFWDQYFWDPGAYSIAQSSRATDIAGY